MRGLGAAIATLSTLTFIALIRVFQNWKLLHLTPWSWKIMKPIFSGILTMGAGYFIKPFIMPFHTIITLTCAGVVIFTVFFIFLWMFGLDEDDKGLLTGIYMILGNIKSSMNL